MKKLILRIRTIVETANFIKWLTVGFSSLIIDVSLFILIFNESESIFLANFLSALCSTIFNYLMHFFWTFNARSKHGDSLVRYILNIVLLWLFGTGIIKVFVLMSFNPFIAKLLSMAIVLPLNFFTLRSFVYKEK